MQFVFPQVLWALLLLAVPIIIHLFYFRRYKKVYFTNVRFLKTIREEKNINRRLKNLLILASRLGALSFLILAFAQPFFGKKGVSAVQTDYVGIYVDNSQSMTALANESDLLNKGLDYAETIIKSYGPGVRFYIMTNDLGPQERQSYLSNQAISMLSHIKPSYQQRSFDQIMNAFGQELASDEVFSADQYIISDYQRTFAAPVDEYDTAINTYLVPIDALEKNNISIDSCWFESPRALVGENQELYIKLTNHNPERETSTTLTLILDDKELPLGQLTIAPSSTVLDTAFVSLPSSKWYEAKVRIKDFPIHFDDEYALSFKPIDQIKVAAIYENNPNRFLNASLGNEQFFDYTSFSKGSINYGELKNQDLIILDHLVSMNSGLEKELAQFLQEGGNVCIFPDARMNSNLITFFGREFDVQFGQWKNTQLGVFGMERNDYLFDNLFFEQHNNFSLPKVQGYYPISSTQYLNALMTFRNDDPFLGRKKVGSGRLYVYSSPLDLKVNELPNYPQFLVPVLYKMGVSKANALKSSYEIGTNAILTLSGESGAHEEVLKLQQSSSEFIPYQEIKEGQRRLFFDNLDLSPGVYDLKNHRDKLEAKVAFNLNRNESSMEFMSSTELQEQYHFASVYDVKTAGQLLSSLKNGAKNNTWWKYFLILALLCLGVEVLLIRFWKN